MELLAEGGTPSAQLGMASWPIRPHGVPTHKLRVHVGHNLRGHKVPVVDQIVMVTRLADKGSKAIRVHPRMELCHSLRDGGQSSVRRQVACTPIA